MRLLISVALLTMLPLVAGADTLNYLGETSSYTGYSGDNASSSAWDYVYSIAPWDWKVTLGWAIVVPIEPTAHFEASGWTYTYYSEAAGGIPAGLDGINDPNVVGQPGIVWWRNGATASDYFHFQTSITGPGRPVYQAYDGGTWSGQTQYSANPEPGSLALMALVLTSGFFWKRRRTTAKPGLTQ